MERLIFDLYRTVLAKLYLEFIQLSFMLEIILLNYKRCYAKSFFNPFGATFVMESMSFVIWSYYIFNHTLSSGIFFGKKFDGMKMKLS